MCLLWGPVAQKLRDHVLAPRCGRAEIARPHVCHHVHAHDKHVVAQFLRDRILEQACGRAEIARPYPMTYVVAQFLRDRILEQVCGPHNIDAVAQFLL